MAKTLPPGEITTKAGKFTVNALPDPFDERDLEYRPRLQPLPGKLDRRKGSIVLKQEGNSCVGHALASMINTVLAHSNGSAIKVSPYMLYWLARRYDEFEGEEDLGSSLRGGLKGWFNHGCALEREWRDLKVERDLNDPVFRSHCTERPLGAFYRINPFRLDDMQSAINELNVVVASAAIHDGWENPQPLRKRTQTNHTIVRAIDAQALGGHAFALVGYDEVGFLVQNSWGDKWGKDGFATLTYEDWLDSAYDAWVARPGVPRTPFASGRNRVAIAAQGEIAIGPGPDLNRLASHVVNLGNDGRLSSHGKFVSTPSQVDGIFRHMDETHKDWTTKSGDSVRRVVLYAHGGLVSEAGGLETAEKHLNWWLNNHVYPISFAWQSGPAETLVNQLSDQVLTKLPFGGIGFDIAEQFDRLVEKTARTTIRWMWDEMKENARRASDPVTAGTSAAKQPGASLVIDRLKKYVQSNGGKVVIHLVGHSAGSIFHAALLRQLAKAELEVETLSLLAPALRLDEFRRDVLPHLGKMVKRTGIFVLSDRRELDDTVGSGKIKVYQKSLLYLVSRALEREPKAFEVPLLGMERFLDAALQQQLSKAKADIIIAPSESSGNSRSDSLTHGGFDDDSPTMTSVALRILGRKTPSAENTYRPYAAMLPAPAGMPAAAPEPPAEQSPRRRRKPAAETPLLRAAAAAAPGSTPLVQTAATPPSPPEPPAQSRAVVVEVASAPRSGSSILDMLLATGWEREAPEEPQPAQPERARAGRPSPSKSKASPTGRKKPVKPS